MRLFESLFRIYFALEREIEREEEEGISFFVGWADEGRDGGVAIPTPSIIGRIAGRGRWAKWAISYATERFVVGVVALSGTDTEPLFLSLSLPVGMYNVM